MSEAAKALRPARVVLAEYLTEIRKLDVYIEAYEQWRDGLAREECDRVLGESDFSNFSFSNILPPKLENDDQAFGSGSWRGEGDDKELYFNFSFIERWTGYKYFGVEQVLYPTGKGAVWLGACNNSASESLTNPADAWACWVAREVIDIGHKRYIE